MGDHPSLPSSITERRLGNAVKVLHNVVEELADVIAHLTNERGFGRMPATTGEEAGEEGRPLDRASAVAEDPYGANLWEEYD